MPILYFALGALGLSVASNVGEDIADRVLPQKQGISTPTLILVIGGTLAAVYAARKYLK